MSERADLSEFVERQYQSNLKMIHDLERRRTDSVCNYCMKTAIDATEALRPELEELLALRVEVAELRETLDEYQTDDLSDCPYFARFTNQPGHDPEATCSYGCVDEPACVTCEPSEGWPIQRLRAENERLQDAVLVLWAELPIQETKLCRQEMPRLAEFCAHLHHSIEHEQAMVRANYWAALTTPEPAKCKCPRFSDTDGYRIADLTCPVHGPSGIGPGDGDWEPTPEQEGTCPYRHGYTPAEDQTEAAAVHRRNECDCP